MKRNVLLAISLLTGIAGASVSATPVAAASHAAANRVHIVGGWVTGPCVPTAFNPTSGSMVCQGSSTWDGTWTGQTDYVVRGTLDVVSGNSKGTIDETFVGIDTATHAGGTLHLTERYVLDGATGALIIDCRLAGATGAFAGASGTVRFIGTTVSVAGGHGGYEGWLTFPRH